MTKKKCPSEEKEQDARLIERRDRSPYLGRNGVVVNAQVVRIIVV